MSAVLSLFFEEDVAHLVDDQYLAVFCNHSPSRADRPGGFVGRGRSPGVRAFCRSFAALFPALSFHHPLLAAVHGGGTLIIRIREGRRTSQTGGVQAGNALNTELIAPCGLPCITNVAVDELSLTLPGEDQGDVVSGTANHNEQAQENRSEPRTEPRVVISSALPFGKSVFEKVVVSFSHRTTEDNSDGVEARGALVGLLECGCQLPLRRTLSAGLVSLGDQSPFDLVRMEKLRFLPVGLDNILLVCIGFDA